MGNHELYVYENALDTFRNFVPLHRGRYLASNVNITHTKGGRSITEPMGRRYAKFTTERGRKVTSLGILFDFKGQDNGLTVQAPTDMVKEAWFLDAIHDRPDFFLLVGHMPVRNDDWPVVIEAIRAVHADVPLVIAGGHTHIRDCVVYDDNAFGIESGRYLETVGWLAFNESDGGGPTAFGRSYIDANRRNYAFHAGLSGPSQLPTSKGRRITRQMDSVAQAWNLTEVYGSTPTDYYLSRVPPSSPSSILHLLAHEVLPTVISTSNANRTGVPNIVLANSGSQRFDIYKGPFTKNDQYIVSPFKDHFLFLRDVPYRHASQIVQRLNTQGPASARATPQDEDMRVNAVYAQWTKQSAAGARVETSAGEEVSLGYVTKDSCPGRGDDTEVRQACNEAGRCTLSPASPCQHSPIPYADQPDFVASPPSNNVTALGPDDAIDVIFLEFALPDSEFRQRRARRWALLTAETLHQSCGCSTPRRTAGTTRHRTPCRTTRSTRRTCTNSMPCKLGAAASRHALCANELKDRVYNELKRESGREERSNSGEDKEVEWLG